MKRDIIAELGCKGADIEGVVRRVISKPELMAELVRVIDCEQGAIRFGCEKVLRLVSEERPELVYPHFDFFVRLLDSDNTFLKCGAILTIGNLCEVDEENRFEGICDRYLGIITGGQLMCAANVIGSAVKIGRARPDLLPRLVPEILKAEKARYRRKGESSPECTRVACQQAIETFDQLFDLIQKKKPVVDFVKRQLGSSRKQAVKKAERFLARYGAI